MKRTSQKNLNKQYESFFILKLYLCFQDPYVMQGSAMSQLFKTMKNDNAVQIG
jgi:hypothetical protein